MKTGSTSDYLWAAAFVVLMLSLCTATLFVGYLLYR